MKLNKLILSTAMFCGAISVSFANNICDDVNSQNCQTYCSYYCDNLPKSKIEKCKSRMIELSKGGKLTTDGTDHLKEILGEYVDYTKIEYVDFKDGKGKTLVKTGDEGQLDIVKFNEYTFAINIPAWDEEKDTYDYSKIESQRCIAYDTKRNALTYLLECGKDDIDFSVPKRDELKK